MKKMTCFAAEFIEKQGMIRNYFQNNYFCGKLTEFDKGLS